jgi:BTB/POZ domain-containing protein 9
MWDLLVSTRFRKMSSTSCEPQVPSGTESVSEVDHVATLSENLKNGLFLNSDYSDVNLIVEGVSFPAHKIILAARSFYFRALLFGGMKESTQSEIELKAAPTVAFKALLKYVYSGRMALGELKEDVVLDVLGYAQNYYFSHESFNKSRADWM